MSTLNVASQNIDDIAQYKILLKHHAKVMNQSLIAIIAILTPCLSVGMYAWLTVMWADIPENKSSIKATSDEIKILTTVSTLFGLLGPLMYTYFIGRIGRKNTLCISYLPYTITSCLLYFGESYRMFFMASCIGCTNYFVSNSLSVVYISEIVSPHLRDIFGFLLVLIVCCAILGGYILCTVMTVKAFSLFLFIFATIGCVLTFLSYDSPYYLIEKSKTKQAKECLTALYNEETIVDRELERLTAAIQRTSKPSITPTCKFWKIFGKRKYLTALLLNLNLQFMFSFSGVDVVMAITPQLLQRNSGCYKYLTVESAVNVTAIVGIVIAAIMTIIIKFFSGRIVYIISSVVTLLGLLLMGLYYLLLDKLPHLVSNCDLLPLGPMLFHMIGTQIGILPVTSVYFRELIPSEVTGLFMFLVDISMPIMSTVSIASFQLCVQLLGGEFVGFVFLACCTALSLVIFILYTPETKGKFLEEVELELEIK